MTWMTDLLDTAEQIDTVKQAQIRESFHEHVTRLVERKFAHGFQFARLYMAGATDEDVARWGRHFGDCKRLPTGYIAFTKKQDDDS